MILMLMCRGHKLFRLQNLEDKTPAEFSAYFLTQQQELEKRQKAGNESCLAVNKYPRAKRHLMYRINRSLISKSQYITLHSKHFILKRCA